MKRWMTWLGVLILFGCGDDSTGDGSDDAIDAGPVDGGVPSAADVRLQLRCPAEGACSGPDEPLDVLGFDEEVSGGGRVVAECSVTTSGDWVLDFRAGLDSNVLSVTGLSFPSGGGAPSGTGCELEIAQSGTTYTGACGGGAPSADQPCRFGPITYDAAGEFGPELEMTLECRGLGASDSSEMRDLTFPMDGTMPAQLELIGCDGV